MTDKKASIGVRPIYKKLLIMAIVIYVIGSCIMMTDLYYRLGVVEHKLYHVFCKK